uniref:Uncharacterized protein n=1 Tax=Sander lucioperca TaxID=283035 RepID=A0A8D0ASN3_SANLU
MSAASCLLTEDQFLCSICLDVFTDPVSTPCGHNLCKTCITQHWDINVQCQCPNCNKVFYTRPEMQVNTFISEMDAQFRQSAQQKHDKLLELFCKTDQMCVCMLCSISDHKQHDVVPLREEYEEKKAERLKIQEIKHSVELSEEDADREIAGGVQVFIALKESVERSQAELIDTITEKQRKMEKQAEGFIKELEQEISELKKRSTEVEQLSQSEDHLHLLQSFTSLNAAPPTKDWTQVSVHPPSYEGTVVRAVNQLEETLSKQMKKLFEVRMRRVQQSAVDVTLNPDTAHPKLILSDDGKQVKHGDVRKSLPNNPYIFDCASVIAKQRFSSGQFYYEVQVKGKTEWDLGVVRYKALANTLEFVCLKSRPEKVGVFVDYEEGLVSFYDVDAAALIYSFTGCLFTEKLYPFFGPSVNYGGKNSDHLSCQSQ